MSGLNLYLMVSEGRVIGKTNTPRDAITQTGLRLKSERGHAQMTTALGWGRGSANI